MSDVFTKEQRSRIMARVSGVDTQPEIIVRKLLHAMGYRFRLHVRKLPGKPDIVLPRRHKIIFVHGCFWHGHSGCPRSKRPSTNEAFWNTKLDANISRDAAVRSELEKQGWEVLVVWGCETKNLNQLRKALEAFCESFQS